MLIEGAESLENKKNLANSTSALDGTTLRIYLVDRTEGIRRIRGHEINLCIVGLGRIGLPTASVFANSGFQVFGADINEAVVREVNSGKCRFSDEEGLGPLVERTTQMGRMRATTDLGTAVSKSDVIIICVPTPVDQSKTPDYTAIVESSTAIGRSLKAGSIVVVESTVGPGTVEEIVRPILERESKMRVSLDIGLASCPERSDPGKIISNMRNVPRIVGAADEHCGDIIAHLYHDSLGVEIFRASDPKTANAIKLTENLFRDVNIALANEFALLYEKLGIDTVEVINGCATKYNFMPHYPGAGVGGPCLPVNSYYLIAEGLKFGNIPYMIRLAREINDRMPDHVVELISDALNEVGKTVKSSKIAVLGIAYKPNVRDFQLSPLEFVCKRLSFMGGSLRIYDPMFIEEYVFGKSFRTEPALSPTVQNADCIVIGTAHDEFKKLDLAKLAKLTNNPAAIVDSRNIIDSKAATNQGFSFRGVGRKSSQPPNSILASHNVDPLVN